jgi:Flagellar protein FliT
MSVYERLAALAEQELELATSGAIDRLPALQAERESVLAALPPRPPAEARHALRRTEALQARAMDLLERRRRQIAAEMSHVGTGRTALRGYAPPVRRTPLLDRSG